MKTIKSITVVKILAHCIMMVAIASPILAEDFTVSVPIDLKSLPSTVSGGLLVVDAYWKTNTDLYSIGHSDVFFDVVGGNYSNTIIVKFNADTNRDPNLANLIVASIKLHEGPLGVYRFPSILFGRNGAFS